MPGVEAAGRPEVDPGGSLITASGGFAAFWPASLVFWENQSPAGPIE